MVKHNKIYNCLLGAAIGDALGAPLKTRTPAMILQDYGSGNLVSDFVKPLDNSVVYGMPIASVTDSFSLPYTLACYIAECGEINSAIVGDALIAWSESKHTKIHFEKFCDGVIRKGIERLKGIPVNDPREYIFCENKTSTASAAARAWVSALFHPGDMDFAVRDAYTITLPTHNSWLALTGAVAVAAAVSAAMIPGVTMDVVVQTAIDAAEKGYEKAKQFGRPSAGANVARRISMAVEIGIKLASDPEKCIVEMTDLVGNGIHTNETVPAAFGYFVAGGGDAMQTIILAANAGGDSTDAGVIAGALAGAFSKGTPFEGAYAEKLKTANSYLNIGDLAQTISEVEI